MPNDNFTVVAFLIGTSLIVAQIVIAQTDWKHKALIYGGLGVSGVLLLAGLLWPWLRDGLPKVAGVVSDVATHPASWFCVIILLLSAHLVLRQRRLSAAPQGSDVASRLDQIEGTHQTQARAQAEINRSLDGMIGRVDDKIDNVAGIFEAKTVTLEKLLRDLSEKTNQQYESTGMGQLRIADSLRARDALEIIKEADKTVVSLAAQLVEAQEAVYPNDAAWLSDYRRWKDAVSIIDQKIIQWNASATHFLDVRSHDLEGVRDMPPDNVNSPRTLTQYKTLCIVNERYNERRNGLINWFVMKATNI